VRPTRILPGIDAPLKRCGPKDLDWVIVRENSEGEYAGVGGRAHQGHPIEVATDVSMMTRAGVNASCASPSGWRSRARASC
jgi:tartrate dehydrogenase/decarboxylase/D-malate dehydrogenase